MEDNPFSSHSSGGQNSSRSRFAWKASLVFGWVAFLVLLASFVLWHMITKEDAQLSTQANEQVDAQEITIPDLDSVNGGLAADAKGRTIEVNGQLKVNSSLVISPTNPPENPVEGQIYYDETTNAPMYYDGDKFVAVATRDDVALLQSTYRQSSITVVQNINPATVTVDDTPVQDPNNLQFASNGFTSTLETAALSGNRSVLLPNASGTVCLQGASDCGFVNGTAANYIQNQSSIAQSGTNYWVSGAGRADGGLIGPSLDTATASVLALGGTASQVTINSDATVNGSLKVTENSSSVNQPLLQLEQSGSGDATIELKNNSGGSFYVGMDQSAGGTLRIGSSTSARTTNSIGSTAAGASAFPGVDGQIIAKKLVTGPSDEGTLASISVNLSAVDAIAPGVKVAIYAHDAANNRPGTLLAATSTSTLGSIGWNAIPLSAPISNNTTYWVAVNIEGSDTGLRFNFCGGCAGEATSTYPRAFNAAWPTEHGPPTNFLDSYEWSMYMDVASGGINDMYAGAKLLSMTASGALTLQNSINTTSAFVVQNAEGDELLRADTAGMKLTVRELEVSYDLSVGGDLTVGGHIRSSGGVPILTAGAASCTTPSVSVDGTDTSGMITVVAGTACGPTGTLATLAFNTAFASAPKVTLTPATSESAGLQTYVDYSQLLPSSFDISTNTPLVDSTTYRWYYHVIE
jgi:hypothetical protein